MLPRSYFPSTFESDNPGATTDMRYLGTMKESGDRFSLSAVNFRRKPKVTLKLVRIARKGFFDESLTADGDYERGKDRERILDGLRLISLLPFPAADVSGGSSSAFFSNYLKYARSTICSWMASRMNPQLG